MSIIARESFNGILISLLEYNNDIYFHAVSCAKSLDYQESKTAVRDFLNRRIDMIKDDVVFVEPSGKGNINVSAIGTVPINYSNASGVFLNFTALSLFIDYSQAPRAPLLKQQMAQSTHRSFLREQKRNQIVPADNSLAMVESLNKQLSYVIEIVKEQEERNLHQENRIQNLEIAARTFAIDRFQRGDVKKQIQQLAYMVADIEDKSKPDQRIYQKLWTNFNDFFGISSYQDLPKERYLEALELLTAWRERLNQELAII